MGTGQGGRKAAQLTSGTRRQIHTARVHREANALNAVFHGKCELDNHADTCCVGKNFIPLYYTGKICDVSPFLQELPSQEGIAVCTAATAFDDDQGTTFILVIDEALWFGECMEHSLINPNQIRATGIKLCDDPTDPYRDLGIEVEGINIPFHMEGSICSFKSRTPTDWELKNCRQIELTSDTEWEPDGLHFGLHSEALLDAPLTISAYKTRHR